MNENSGLNRAKLYQLALFPMNNGATNVYFVLILSYVATFGENILGLIGFASVMVTVMRLFDAVTDPIIGALMDKTSTKFGKFRPFNGKTGCVHRCARCGSGQGGGCRPHRQGYGSRWCRHYGNHFPHRLRA